MDYSTNRLGGYAPAGIAFALSGIAGYVDAVCFLCLASVFTSHMSGNTAAMGAHVGQGTWDLVARRAVPIPLFVAGVVIGAAVSEVSVLRRRRSPHTAALVIEMSLLFALAFFGGHLVLSKTAAVTRDWRFWLAIAAATLAMGMQTAAIRRAGRWTVNTTFVTGALTESGERLGALLLARFGVKSTPDFDVARMRPELRVHGGTWACFAIGAVLGGLIQPHYQLYSIFLAVGALAIVTIIDWASSGWDNPKTSAERSLRKKAQQHKRL